MTAMTVRQLFQAHDDWAREYYCRPPSRAGGPRSPTASINNIRQAARWLLETPDPTPPPAGLLFRTDGRTLADVPVEEFTTSMLRAAQHRMAGGLCRYVCNDYLAWQQRVFLWGAKRSMVAEDRAMALDRLVEPLQFGRSNAKESPPLQLNFSRGDVMQLVWAIQKRKPMLACMIQVQYWTAMRPGEVVQMCRSAICMANEPWEYLPEHHKTQHYGKERRIDMGPEARRALKPWLEMWHGEWLFPGRDGHIRPQSYYLMVQREIAREKTTHWTVKYLRHLRSTDLERETGDPVDSQLLLDHNSVATTKRHYINGRRTSEDEKNEQRKRDLAERYG